MASLVTITPPVLLFEDRNLVLRYHRGTVGGNCNYSNRLLFQCESLNHQPLLVLPAPDFLFAAFPTATDSVVTWGA